ncbi:MAG TPA: hypothetical protein VGK11_10720 [Actinomycetota bacterium]
MRRAFIGVVVALTGGGFGLGYVVGTRADRIEVPGVLGLGRRMAGRQHPSVGQYVKDGGDVLEGGNGRARRDWGYLELRQAGTR